MNSYYIRQRVWEIASMAHDPEAAHGEEDRLHKQFIEYIASHGPDPFAEMAKEVLKTEDIDFSRWCA
jgi:hypothetical protein